MTDILRCPVCGDRLSSGQTGLRCGAGHCFDRAREGYVNLLRGNRPGSSRGDGREMALSRRAFLNGDYYLPLAEAVCRLAGENSKKASAILDVCCGEGYYTQKLVSALPDRRVFGFDISREMVRLAAKRRCGAEFFVANLAAIPVADESVDVAVHLFAPFNGGEFSRILSPRGVLLSVIPGRDHLMGLKRELYDRPYQNDEAEPASGELCLTERVRVRSSICLQGSEDIFSLFQMTPYYFKTSAVAAEKVRKLERLETETDFVILIYRKKTV